MNSLNIEILNPKARKLLQELVDLRLISISENNPDPFLAALKGIRAKKAKLSLKEITEEVEVVRTKRYAR